MLHFAEKGCQIASRSDLTILEGIHRSRHSIVPCSNTGFLTVCHGTGLITSSNASHNSILVSYIDMTTRGPSTRIQRSLANGLPLHRTSRPNMVLYVDNDVYNFDKTGFIMGIIFPGTVVITSNSRSKAKLAQPGNREWAKVI